jgi:hypothetical protein
MANRSIPKPIPAVGGHAVFESAQEIFIHGHGFFVAALGPSALLLEAFALVYGVVQL